VDQKPIAVPPIQARAKDPESVEKHLSKLMSRYKSLSDFKDLAGVRVITYFSDHVDQVLEIVRREFDVVSIDDKRASQEPDRFGYASVRCDCKWSCARLALPENRQFQDIPVEIQVCTILQHAWAEIEHDRVYKAVGPVATPIRRRFARLAGLLELADEEFLGIREVSDANAQQVRGNIAARPDDVPIDKVSISELVRSSSLVREVDDEIAAVPGTEVRPIDDDDCELLARTLSYVGLASLGEVVNELSQRKQDILKLGQLQLKGKRVASVAAGMSLFYVFLIMLARERDYKGVMEGLDHFLIAHPGDDRPELARLLVQHFRPR
jgi:ppGpp synthetase/RelA/SpoT-type nucleotidyltranferase